MKSVLDLAYCTIVEADFDIPRTYVAILNVNDKLKMATSKLRWVFCKFQFGNSDDSQLTSTWSMMRMVDSVW